MRSRYTFLVIAIVGAVAISIATGGVTPAELDRGAAINVIGDPAANVGYEASCGEGTFSITITNRFNRPLHDVSVTVNESTESPGSLPIQSGDSRTVEFEVDAVAHGDLVVVHASGAGVDVSLDRSVPAVCS